MKKNLKLIFLSVALLAFFVKFNDLFRNIYFINAFDYQERINKKKSFCDEQSYPFLNYIKKKHQISGEPKIVNYMPLPSPRWYFLNNKNGVINDKYLIILNYEKNLEYNFSLNKKFLVNSNSFNDGLYEKLGGIEIIFEDFISEDFIENIKFKFYQSDFDGKKYQVGKINGNSFTIEKDQKLVKFFNLNKNVNISSRMRSIFLKIENNNIDITKQIKSAKINLINSYNLKNFQILEKKDNCYLIQL